MRTSCNFSAYIDRLLFFSYLEEYGRQFMIYDNIETFQYKINTCFEETLK